MKNVQIPISVFSQNAGKYGPEITSYLGIFHAVEALRKVTIFEEKYYIRKSSRANSYVSLIFASASCPSNLRNKYNDFTYLQSILTF